MSELFERQKCLQRNRLAAKRDGVNAFPLRMLKSGAELSGGASVVTAAGSLPATDEAALEQINSLLPEGAAALTLDQVYIHYMEAANSSYVADRGMFLARNTLKNIAREACPGVAFMNSHRTGGLSHPSELPFGRTFAGRFEITREDGGETADRALIGMYMLRGQSPNGQSGPSTDALHASIQGGTIFDVSVGLFGGDEICDVCGNDIYAYESGKGYLCPHGPCTTYKMTPEEIEAQEGRGVPGGVCTYSLVDSHLSEVSAVYDGAVPGAGFRKVLSLSREQRLSSEHLAQARKAFAPLLRGGELGMEDGIVGAIEGLLRKFGLRPQDELKPEPKGEAKPEPAALPAAGAENLNAQNAELTATAAATAAELEKLKAERAAEKRLAMADRAEAFAELMSSDTERRIVPAEREALQELHLNAAIDDEVRPLAKGSRVELLEQSYRERPKHSLSVEVLGAAPAGSRVLHTQADQNTVSEERRRELLSASNLGRAVLAEEDKANKSAARPAK